MLDPPVETPISRIMRREAERRDWYCLSERVWAGATVMESPVWTPMGSTFSMEQMTTTLSARSRMTSSSNSFQPATLFSTRAERTGLASRPSRTAGLSSRWSWAMAPPLPPRVKLGRIMRGKPISRARSSASARSRTVQLDAVVVEDARLVQLDGEVERRLAAEGREEGVGAFAADDLLDRAGGQRFDVGRVGDLGVGHYGGGVRVHQDHAVALLAQGVARLGARVVELGGLPDHDRAGADDQDARDVVAARHVVYARACAEILLTNPSKR